MASTRHTQTSTTAGRLLKAAERRAFILDLRTTGATYRQIAATAIKRFSVERLPKNYDARQAYQDVKRELDRLNRERRESALEVRRLEVERLDKMLVAIAKPLRAGELGAIDRALRIMARRAKFLGLDMPTQVEIRDWRKEAEQAGLSPSDLFEQMVAAAVEKLESETAETEK